MPGNSFGQLRDGFQAGRSVWSFSRGWLSTLLRRFFPDAAYQPIRGPGVAGISRILPPTYGLEGIRRVLIEGEGFAQVREPFLTLMIFLVVLLPFSLWVFNRAVRRAKREGSLIQY